MAGPGEDCPIEEILAQALGVGVASMTDPALHGRVDVGPSQAVFGIASGKPAQLA
jgi:hypothetical protein